MTPEFDVGERVTILANGWRVVGDVVGVADKGGRVEYTLDTVSSEQDDPLVEELARELWDDFTPSFPVTWFGEGTPRAAFRAAAQKLIASGWCKERGGTMSDMEAINGRTRPLVRLWDRDFNLIYSGEGDVGEVIGHLTLSVDHVDGTPRAGGRITSVSVASPHSAEERIPESPSA